MRCLRAMGVVMCCVVAPVMVSCAGGGSGRRAESRVASVEAPTVEDQSARDYPGLPNVVAYHDGYYSGGAPEGEAGFATLAAMGVRTIISVDGAAPDAEAARAHGMRYIHLPIGYDGFDERRKLELVRASRDSLADGPVYVHCHHGKHRSAGAAATVAASLGWDTPEEAVARMRVSGTSPNYAGLYACAAGARLVSVAEIDAMPGKFPEVSRPRGFVKGMVEIDEVHDRLGAIERAGWATPADHPDLVPVAEAGRLADLLRYCAESDRTRSEPADFGRDLLACRDLAQGLEDLLDAGADAGALSEQFRLVGDSCKQCHTAHRD